MSAAFDELNAILATLPDTFVINEPTLTPVIEPGKHGIVFYVPTLSPTRQLDNGTMEVTWNIAVISPVTGLKAAGPALFDATIEVLGALETAKTTRWDSATMEPYNDTLWCYSVIVTMYANKEE